MGDRVAVLHMGVLQQCDTPQYLYDHPDNIFVAAFIGTPAMNLYEAVLTEGARSIKLGSQEMTAAGSRPGKALRRWPLMRARMSSWACVPSTCLRRSLARPARLSSLRWT